MAGQDLLEGYRRIARHWRLGDADAEFAGYLATLERRSEIESVSDYWATRSFVAQLAQSLTPQALDEIVIEIFGDPFSRCNTSERFRTYKFILASGQPSYKLDILQPERKS